MSMAKALREFGLPKGSYVCGITAQQFGPGGNFAAAYRTTVEESKDKEGLGSQERLVVLEKNFRGIEKGIEKNIQPEMEHANFKDISQEENILDSSQKYNENTISTTKASEKEDLGKLKLEVVSNRAPIQELPVQVQEMDMPAKNKEPKDERKEEQIKPAFPARGVLSMHHVQGKEDKEQEMRTR